MSVLSAILHTVCTMPFKKGDKKPVGSGRVKGVPSKLSAQVAQRLNELGCDPVTGLARLAMGENEDSNVRRAAYAELMKYTYPRLTAIDHRLVDGEGKDRSLISEMDRLVALADENAPAL